MIDNRLSKQLNTYTTFSAALRGALLSMGHSGRAALLALVLALCGATVLGSGVVHAEEAAPTAQATVNINKADAATLAEKLKGVGHARAEDIVRYREAYGPFASVEELMEVKGIGPATLDVNRTLITLE